MYALVIGMPVRTGSMTRWTRYWQRLQAASRWLLT
jgi:hypothetical protein